MPCKAKSFPFFFPTQCLPKPLPHIFELSHILFKKIRNGDSVVKFHSIQRLCGQWSAFLSHKNRKRSLCTLCNDCLRGLHPLLLVLLATSWSNCCHRAEACHLCNAILVNTQSFPPVYFRIVSAPIGFVCVPLSESEVRIASVHLELLDIED